MVVRRATNKGSARRPLEFLRCKRGVSWSVDGGGASSDEERFRQASAWIGPWVWVWVWVWVWISAWEWVWVWV